MATVKGSVSPLALAGALASGEALAPAGSLAFALASGLAAALALALALSVTLAHFACLLYLFLGVEKSYVSPRDRSGDCSGVQDWGSALFVAIKQDKVVTSGDTLSGKIVRCMR